MTKLTPLEQAMILETALRNLQRPVDIVNLVDASGSVSELQFGIMQFCMRSIARLFKFPAAGSLTVPPVRIGAIQFSSDAYIISNLTANPVAYNTSVVTMVRRSGGTETGKGLAACEHMFGLQSNGRSKAIILFTDGDVANATEIHRRMTQNTTILSIGIGLTHPAHMQSVAAISQTSIFVQTVEEMHQVISNMNVLPESPPEVVQRTKSAKRVSFDIHYSEPVSVVELVYCKEGLNNWTTETAHHNIVFINNLTPGSKYRIKAKVQTASGAWTQWCDDLAFETLSENPETALLKSPHISQTCNALVNELNNLRVPDEWLALGMECYNIILLGCVGNGKSCFTNSINSVLQGAYGEVAHHQVSIQTVTLQIHKYRLRDFQCVWDTYGWRVDAPNSYAQEFEFLLDGAVKDGYKEGTSILGELNTSPQIQDKVHTIIVVYEMPAIMTDSNMKTMKVFYDKMTAKGYQPIVVLTKADKIKEAELADNLSDIYDTGVIDVYIKTFCESTNIPFKNVYPVVNFCGMWQGRNYVQEKLILNPFKAALQFAHSKVKRFMNFRLVLKDKTTGAVKAQLDHTGGADATIASILAIGTNVSVFKGLNIYVKSTEQLLPVESYATSKLNQVGIQRVDVGFWEIKITDTNPINNNNNNNNSSSSSSNNNNSNSNNNNLTPDVAIFVDRSASSIGMVPMFSLTGFVSSLRRQIDEDGVFEDDEELQKSYSFVQEFVAVGGGVMKNKVLLEELEESTKVSELVKNDAGRFRVHVTRKFEMISIVLEGGRSVGMLVNAPRGEKLAHTRPRVLEADVDFRFKFVCGGSPLTIAQEAGRSLRDVLGYDEKEGIPFIVIRKLD